MDDRPTIRAADLAIGYGGEAVVDSVSFQLHPAQVLCLMGTNGCGKSTMLRTLAGLLPPLGGVIEVLGRVPPADPRTVSYLSQHPASSAGLSLRASDVVEMGRFARLGLARRAGAEDRRACAVAAERLDVAHLAGMAMNRLSGGQRQRVHLAQALAREAELLLLDEPTAGLDPRSRERWSAIVDEERGAGRSVVMATHDLADAESADLVMLLAHRVVAFGPPGEVLTDANLRQCYGFTEQH